MTERTFTAAENRHMAAVFPLQRGHEAECQCPQCVMFVDALRQAAAAESRWEQLKAFINKTVPTPDANEIDFEIARLEGERP